MKTKIILGGVLLLISNLQLAAQEAEKALENTGGSSMGWFEIVFAVSIVLGIFLLLPAIIYTNFNEHIKETTDDDLNFASAEERNQRAIAILEEVDEKLTTVTEEDGTELITLTNGSQARFLKHALDFINTKLNPTDEDIRAHVKSLEEVYDERTERFFTGSNWILIAGAALAVLIYFTAGWNSFIPIQLAGLTFYFLASRTPKYQLEKRMERFGGLKLGIVGATLGALFAGDNTRYYTVDSFGNKERDWETEGSTSLFGLLIALFAALFVGLFVSLFGILNGVINYSTSFLYPINLDSWYEKNISTKREEMLKPAD